MVLFANVFIVTFMIQYIIGTLSLMTFLVQSVIVKCVMLVVFHFLVSMAMCSLLFAAYSPFPKIPRKYYLPDSVLTAIKQLPQDVTLLARSNEIREQYVKDAGLVVHDRMLYTPTTTPGGGDGRPMLLTLNFCKSCSCIKPDRVHHCHSCHACVPRLDHHCLLIGGCVHAGNHKCFLLFLMYTWLACTIVGVGFLPYQFVGIWNFIIGRFDVEMGPVSILFAVVQFVSLVYAVFNVIPMMVIHMHLVCQNQTTIDNINKYTAYRPMHVVGYDTGNTYKNWKLMMGEWQEWWSPWEIPLIKNDAWIRDSRFALITRKYNELNMID